MELRQHAAWEYVENKKGYIIGAIKKKVEATEKELSGEPPELAESFKEKMRKFQEKFRMGIVED